jgi:hypothetical protein
VVKFYVCWKIGGVHPLHANQQTGLDKSGKGAPHGTEITCFAADA